MSASHPQRVLLATHTFAFWGGLQDWAVGMARGLKTLGVEVGFVTNNERMEQLAAPFSAETFLIDWSDWRSDVSRIMDSGPWDVVFSQPFGSRELGVELKTRFGVPLVVMCHGNNSDSVYAWGGVADGILLASTSLVRTMVDFGHVEPRKVAVLPNGVPDEFFEEELAPFEERLTPDGRASLVVASRLAVDKLNQVPAMELLVSTLLRQPEVRSISIEVLGGGPMRSVYESRFSALALSEPRVQVDMVGWVDVNTVKEHMRRALFTVVGGVSGTQSVSLGTACLGAGIRCVAGVSTPDNIDAVLGTNFGDHAVLDIDSRKIAADVQWMMEPNNYTAFQQVYGPLTRSERSHTAVARRALDLLTEAVNRYGEDRDD